MSDESRNERCEFVPDVSRLGTVRFRIEAVDPQTGKSGRSNWMGALSVDVANDEPTGLRWEEMAQEAYADIWRD